MSSETHSSELIPSPYFTSGFETASLLSSDAQTAFLSGNLYDPQNNPRFPILAERFIANNDLLSQKRKETEQKRLQTPNLELKFEVKVKFQGLNPHPIFHVSKTEHKTSPALFQVVHIEFERDLNISTITYGKIIFCNPHSGLR